MARGGRTLVAGLIASLGLWVAIGALPPGDPASEARAADGYIEHIAIGEAESSRFVRIPLNKSLIVHLPQEARDVLVSGPAVVEAVVRSKRTVYLIGREVGQTNVFFFDQDGRQILNLEVEVERDLLALKAMLDRVLPDNSISVDSINGNVVLTGTVTSALHSKQASDIAAKFAGEADRVLNMIAITGREQVALRVTVAEVQRSVIKQFGVDLAAAVDIGGQSVFRFATVNPFSLGLGAISGTNFTVQDLTGANQFQNILRAMERNGLVRTLAEPTLTAISGEAANFLAGGEFPIPVAGDDDRITIEFKPFGVGLAFTPVVLSEGRISLKISTEVSEISSSGAIALTPGGTDATLTIPALRVRRAETTVELPSGGSVVMAGLIQDDVRQDLNGVPGLKDVPILGSLFRSRDFQNSETELVVIVTPYTVDPVSRDQLMRPDERLNIAKDATTIFLGRLNKIYGTAGGDPDGAYYGTVGFIVE